MKYPISKFFLGVYTINNVNNKSELLMNARTLRFNTNGAKIDIASHTLEMVIKTPNAPKATYKFDLDAFVVANANTGNVEFVEDKFVAIMAKKFEELRLADTKEKGFDRLTSYLKLLYKKNWNSIPAITTVANTALEKDLLSKNFVGDDIAIENVFRTRDGKGIVFSFKPANSIFNTGNILDRVIPLDKVWNGTSLNSAIVDKYIETAIVNQF